MNKIRIAKIAGIAAGATLAFGSFIPMVGAVTIAELQAQINALLAQLATLQGGTTTTTTACTFTRSLTMNSTGADVTCLQNYLTGTGHFIFAGGATGYFGSITKAAVAAWQAANGVAPAVGYFGPISQARYSAVAGTTVPGTTVGITTPGVEGTITASKAATPASGTKAYEGGSKMGVLGIKLEAKISDIKIERVKLQLSADTTDASSSGNSDQQFYTKIANNIYVMEGSSYYITIAGFSFIVPKDATEVLTIAVDPKASWDSAYDDDNWKLTVPVDGIRGVDGANINQFSPTTAFNNVFTSAADVVDSAALTVSLASDSPITSQVIANQGSSDNELDGLTLAKFNFKGEKDQVMVTDLVVDIVRGGVANASSATATTAWIYDGSTAIGSASVVGTSLTAMSATFSDIDWIIPADTTKTLTVKIDVDSAQLTADTFAADIGSTSAVATNVTSENSAGSSITETGSAVGKTITVRKVGPEISLVSKSITTNGVPQSNDSLTKSTSTLTATFNVKIKAVGGTLTFGTVASGTPLMASTTSNSLTGGSFLVYRNGAADASISSYSTSTSYSIPTGCTSTGTNSCNLTDGNEVTIPVTFSILGRSGNAASFVALSNGLYSVQFGGIQWWNATTGLVQTTDFMSTDVDWRTSDVSFP